MSHDRLGSVAVALAVLLVTAGVAGVGATPPADASTRTGGVGQAAAASNHTAGNDTAGDAATVTVTGSGEASADPDVAIVRVASVATAADSSTAVERLARNVSQMRESLFAANVSRDQLRTTSIQVSPRERDRRSGDSVFSNDTRFVAVQSFEIRLENTSRVGEVVDVAVQNGADRVGGVGFTLSDETRREVMQEALREAVTDARSQAETIAASAGLNIAGVRSVSTQSFPVFQSVERDVGGGASGTVVDPGSVTVSATVTVTYNATN